MDQNVLVIGGGNIGTEFACEFAAKGCRVNIYSSKPEKYNGELCVLDSSGHIQCRGNVALVTDDFRKAAEGCNLVFVIVPAFMFRETAKKLLPFVSEKMCIGVIPGTGGAEFAFAECIHRGALLFGLQRVPGVARLVEYGKSVCVEGKRNELFLGAASERECTEEIKSIAGYLAEAIGITCRVLPNYLNVTLTPSNPILHTTRLCTMFKGYHPGVYYDRNPLFYGEWSLESSELLLQCDDELRSFIKTLDQMDLSMVKSLRDHYESSNAQQMTDKIRSIPSLHELRSPMICTEQGWIPDFDSRYFTSDFPYGLSILIELAHAAEVSVPYMEYTMNWYQKVTGRKQIFDLKSAGIRNKEDIYRFYR